MPVISNGSAHFQTVTYTGNGGTNTITGLSFKPDFVWIKGRSGATDHALYDAVRGTTLDLASNTTAAETTQSTGLTSFNSDGFTLGALSKVNTNSATYVAWCWKAGGAGSTNTSGTITSTVSANTTAGFSVVGFTGVPISAGASTIGHGLGVAPSFVIFKNRDAVDGWYCYHASLGNSAYIILNTTAAQVTGSNLWNSTSPTSSVLTLRNNSLNSSTSQNLIAYCFAAVAGYSAFGSYVGNNSDDGPFIHLGFRPRFFMVKDAGTAGAWIIIDASRAAYNVSSNYLFPNTPAVEAASPPQCDFLANGIKLRANNANSGQNNVAGNTYIYAAFAENPFKYALAR